MEDKLIDRHAGKSARLTGHAEADCQRVVDAAEGDFQMALDLLGEASRLWPDRSTQVQIAIRLPQTVSDLTAAPREPKEIAVAFGERDYVIRLRLWPGGWTYQVFLDGRALDNEVGPAGGKEVAESFAWEFIEGQG